MITLFFEGSEDFKGQLALFELDRSTKEFYLTSSKTMMQRTKHNWKMLFDPGKEKLQEKITDMLKDDEFIRVLQIRMAQAGYNLRNKAIENGNIR